MDYAYVRGKPKDDDGNIDIAKWHEQGTELAARCEYGGRVKASRDGDCWHEYRTASVVVPIHEFEATLLSALEAIGVHRFPVNASIPLLHGIPDGKASPPFAHLDPSYYRSQAWHACPPDHQAAS